MPAIVTEALQPQSILTYTWVLFSSMGVDLFFPWSLPEHNKFRLLDQALMTNHNDTGYVVGSWYIRWIYGPAVLLKNYLSPAIHCRLRFLLEECNADVCQLYWIKTSLIIFHSGTTVPGFCIFSGCFPASAAVQQFSQVQGTIILTACLISLVFSMKFLYKLCRLVLTTYCLLLCSIFSPHVLRQWN